MCCHPLSVHPLPPPHCIIKAAGQRFLHTFPELHSWATFLACPHGYVGRRGPRRDGRGHRTKSGVTEGLSIKANISAHPHLLLLLMHLTEAGDPNCRTRNCQSLPQQSRHTGKTPTPSATTNSHSTRLFNVLEQLLDFLKRKKGDVGLRAVGNTITKSYLKLQRQIAFVRK